MSKAKKTTKRAASAPTRTAPKAKAARADAPVVTDWSKCRSHAKLTTKATLRSPVHFRHGLLTEGSPVSFSWGFYWFSSPEDRTAFVARSFQLEAKEHIREPDPDAEREILAQLKDFGDGPTGDLPSFTIFEDDARWAGTLDELLRGKSAFAKKCRGDFWENYEGGDVAAKTPIPDDLIEHFLETLRMEP